MIIFQTGWSARYATAHVTQIFIGAFIRVGDIMREFMAYALLYQQMLYYELKYGHFGGLIILFLLVDSRVCEKVLEIY